ncbi:Trm112 family protein [Mesorhizobium sp. 128a]
MAADGREGKAANVDPKLLELLACPLTKGPLAWDPERGELISRVAKLAYPVRDGIPIMLPSEARSISAEDVLSPPRLSGPAQAGR